MKISITINNC